MNLSCLINHGCNLSGISCQGLNFTWYMNDSSIQTNQRSYRIRLSSNLDRLIQNMPDFYDSGTVYSQDSTSVSYTGPSFEYASIYYVKISVQYMNDDTVYECSPIKFITEISPDGWHANWICAPKSHGKNEFTFFRKKESIHKKIKSALMYVSAHNHFKMWINQKAVNSFVSPAPSQIYDSKYYLTYDISHLLKAGDNLLGCILYYLNTSGQNYMNGLPGFLMQTFLTYDDGTTELWVSDETWKALDQTPYYSDMPCQQNRRISSVIQYDFNHEAVKFLENDYNDSHWMQAVPSGINAQNWSLRPQFIPEGIVNERLCPQALCTQNIGCQVFDVGKIISGWVEVHVDGIKGARITIRYSEDMDDAGRVKHNVANEKSDYYYDTCILSDEKALVFAADFTYKAFRYFEIIDYPSLISPSQITVISAGTDLSYHSDFQSSDPLLNQVYEACIQTQKNNTLNQLTDCPHREQSQYNGDSYLQSETLLYNFNAYPMLKKVLDDFKYGQFHDGRFPFVFPSNFECEDFCLNIPEYDLYYGCILWTVYDFYYDVDILKLYYPTLQKILQYFINKIDSKYGLVERAAGWHISDWPYSQVDDENVSHLTVENCLVYHNLCIAAKIANILSVPYAADRYHAVAVNLKQAVNTYLFDPDKMLFRDGLGSQNCSQAANTACFYYGLLNGQDPQDLLDKIVAMPFGCSVIMTNRLLHILFTHGKQEEAYRILSSQGQPSWKYMMSLNYRTIWEGFSNIESHCHAWNAYPARFMQEFICGIQMKSPGFDETRIKPYIPNDLTYAKARILTPKGTILSGWEKFDSYILFEISIPVNVSAVFEVPKVCIQPRSQQNILLTAGLNTIKLTLWNENH